MFGSETGKLTWHRHPSHRRLSLDVWGYDRCLGAKAAWQALWTRQQLISIWFTCLSPLVSIEITHYRTKVYTYVCMCMCWKKKPCITITMFWWFHLQYTLALLTYGISWHWQSSQAHDVLRHWPFHTCTVDLLNGQWSDVCVCPCSMMKMVAIDMYRTAPPIFTWSSLSI